MLFKKKTVLAALVTAIVIVLSCFGSASAVSQSDVNSLQQQKNELEQRAQEIKSNIAALQNDASKQEQLKAQLQRQISNTEEQISVCSNEISSLNASIDELEVQIAEEEATLASTKELFKQRLRAMYMSGSSNELLVLLSSDDVADYLAKSELTRSVSEHDSQLMDDIVETMEAIVAAQDKIKNDKDSMESAQQQLTQKQNELESQITDANSALSSIQSSTASLTTEQKAVEAAQEKYEDDIAAALDAMKKQEESSKQQSSSSSSSSSSASSSTGGTSSSSGGSSSSATSFKWPTPGFTYISSPFGYRIHPITGVQKLHSGIDIAGTNIYGTPVYAADSGTVSLATFNSGGYGYYVMLYHGTKSDGKQYATLYAHMTKYIVSYGQHVNKGDIIGYVGSTGASTGPHLHFEIRVNGTAVNPLLYF